MPEQSNCKSFGGLSVRSAGRFGARQKSLRLIDRVPGRFDLLAQLRNLATGRRDQFSRLNHECALLGIHWIAARRSSGVAAPFINGRRPQHGWRNRLLAAARRIRPINHNGWHFGPPFRSRQVIALRSGNHLPADRAHRLLAAAFSTVSSIRKPARRPSNGSSARSIRSTRRAALSPIRLQGWKPPLRG